MLFPLYSQVMQKVHDLEREVPRLNNAFGRGGAVHLVRVVSTKVLHRHGEGIAQVVVEAAGFAALAEVEQGALGRGERRIVVLKSGRRSRRGGWEFVRRHNEIRCAATLMVSPLTADKGKQMDTRAPLIFNKLLSEGSDVWMDRRGKGSGDFDTNVIFF